MWTTVHRRAVSLGKTIMQWNGTGFDLTKITFGNEPPPGVPRHESRCVDRNALVELHLEAWVGAGQATTDILRKRA